MEGKCYRQYVRDPAKPLPKTMKWRLNKQLVPSQTESSGKYFICKNKSFKQCCTTERASK